MTESEFERWQRDAARLIWALTKRLGGEVVLASNDMPPPDWTLTRDDDFLLHTIILRAGTKSVPPARTGRPIGDRITDAAPAGIPADRPESWRHAERQRRATVPLLERCPRCDGMPMPNPFSPAGVCATSPVLEEMAEGAWRIQCYGCGLSAKATDREEAVAIWNWRPGAETEG